MNTSSSVMSGAWLTTWDWGRHDALRDPSEWFEESNPWRLKTIWQHDNSDTGNRTRELLHPGIFLSSTGSSCVHHYTISKVKSNNNLGLLCRMPYAFWCWCHSHRKAMIVEHRVAATTNIETELLTRKTHQRRLWYDDGFGGSQKIRYFPYWNLFHVRNNHILFQYSDLSVNYQNCKECSRCQDINIHPKFWCRQYASWSTCLARTTT